VINIEDIIPTHNTLRNTYTVDHFIKMIKSVAFYELEDVLNCEKRIVINTCEDGKNYCMDGHHRIVALLCVDEFCLYDSHYKKTDYSYSELLEISDGSINRGWYTPFDPRCSCRLADYADYRIGIKNYPEYAKKTVLNGFINDRYKQMRKIYNFKELHYLYSYYKENGVYAL
jgi:hypothetical protein